MQRKLSDALLAMIGDSPVVVIHSSLVGVLSSQRASRWDILKAFRQLADRGITLAVPTFTFAYCRDRVYHHQRTEPETGILGTWTLDLVGARRTKHPIYSFAVLGPLAGRLDACRNSTTWGDDSIFAEFERCDATVVMFGCDWSYCTFFHRVEEGARVPYRTVKAFPGSADFGDGVQAVAPTMWVRDAEINADNDWEPLVDRLRANKAIREAGFLGVRIRAASGAAIMAAGRDLLSVNSWALVRDGRRVESDWHARRHAAASSPIRVALLGHANVDLLATAIREELRQLVPECAIDVVTTPFGQASTEIRTPTSRLHAVAPALCICVDRLEDLFALHRLDEVDPQRAADRVADYVEVIRAYHLSTRTTTLVHDFADTQPRTLSFSDESESDGISRLIELCNRLLREGLASLEGVVIVSTAHLIARAGVPSYDDRLWHLGRVPYAQAFSRFLAEQYAAAFLAATGRTVRVIVVDLDDTLWRGVLGEDGFSGIQMGGDYPGSAFREFQRTLRGLSERGVALAICSKNDPEPVLDVFARHPDMILTAEHFAVMRIGWAPKADAVVAICQELNLGLHQVLFVDDSPVERAAIRRALPEVKVLDMPVDPTERARHLLSCPWLGCLVLTVEDRRRAEAYLEHAAVVSAREAAGSDLTAFQRSLAVTVYLQPLDDGNIVRAAQLMAKTNQFNTTTRRYTVQELRELVSEGHLVVVIGAEDSFVPRENIGVLVVRLGSPTLQDAFVDDYLLSCRALGKGIEMAGLHWLANRLRMQGFQRLVGEIIETERNTPAREVFRESGFAQQAHESAIWQLPLDKTIVTWRGESVVSIKDGLPALSGVPALTREMK